MANRWGEMETVADFIFLGSKREWEIDGETASDFNFGAPKSLLMVIAAMKLKDACSLEEKIWQT